MYVLKLSLFQGLTNAYKQILVFLITLIEALYEKGWSWSPILL